MEKNQDKIRKFLEPASEVSGGLIATGVGLIFAGPAGAFAGSIVAPIFSRTCLGLYDRIMAYRDCARVGTAIIYSAMDIEERLSNGESLRDDGFINSEIVRSSADEVLEGVILKSSTEHEEKKTKYYGYIFSTSAFDSRFSSENINHALSIAQRLTYRQLCLIYVFSQSQSFHLNDRSYQHLSEIEVRWELDVILSEAFQLYRENLIKCRMPNDRDDEALLDMYDIHPALMRLTTFGKRIYDLMQLKKIPTEDIENIVKTLS